MPLRKVLLRVLKVQRVPLLRARAQDRALVRLSIVSKTDQSAGVCLRWARRTPAWMTSTGTCSRGLPLRTAKKRKVKRDYERTRHDVDSDFNHNPRMCPQTPVHITLPHITLPQKQTHTAAKKNKFPQKHQNTELNYSGRYKTPRHQSIKRPEDLAGRFLFHQQRVPRSW